MQLLTLFDAKILMDSLISKRIVLKTTQLKRVSFNTEIRFIYSEKATQFCEIFTYLLTVCTVVKS